MGVRYRCALCGTTTRKNQLDNHVCQTCRTQYDVSEDWAQELIRAEQVWHKSQSNNAGTVKFSRIHHRENHRHYDGDDMLNGDVAFPYMRRGHIPENKKVKKTDPSPSNYLDNLEIVLKWGDIAELTDHEKQAIEIIVLFMQDQTVSLEAASQILSDIEGNEITPLEFRDRLNQARQKLLDAGIHDG